MSRQTGAKFVPLTAKGSNQIITVICCLILFLLILKISIQCRFLRCVLHQPPISLPQLFATEWCSKKKLRTVVPLTNQLLDQTRLDSFRHFCHCLRRVSAYTYFYVKALHVVRLARDLCMCKACTRISRQETSEQLFLYR